MNLRIPRLLVLGMCLGTFPLLGQEPPASPLVHEIHITAQKYRYTPNEIHVAKGEHVKLVLTALDRTHGFKIESLGIERKIEKGKETIVELDADHEGVIPFQCSVFCGLGHGKMKGRIIVAPAPTP